MSSKLLMDKKVSVLKRKLGDVLDNKYGWSVFFPKSNTELRAVVYKDWVSKYTKDPKGLLFEYVFSESELEEFDSTFDGVKTLIKHMKKANAQYFI